MRYWIRDFKRIWNIYQKKPYILISSSGSLTPKPKVHVSLHSYTGLMGVFTYPDDSVGNAQVESLAKTMSHITGLNIHDERK